MGDVGARLLAKALQINNKLRTIILDRNNITLQGTPSECFLYLQLNILTLFSLLFTRIQRYRLRFGE